MAARSVSWRQEGIVMAYHDDIMDELQSLKREAGRAVNKGAEELRHASGEAAATIAAELKTFLGDIRAALASDDAEGERAFAGRAATALATAFTLGATIGWIMGRRR
jgi:hypothetical protein